MTDPAFAARCLLRAARAGTLATGDRGQPFASLVTPATTPEGDVLLLLSALSAHTRHLAIEPRCALMVCGPAEGVNPQTAPRLTVIGRAAADADPDLRELWLARHPYAAEYASFADFSVWRLSVESGRYVGGFARAYVLDAAALHAPPGPVEAVRAAMMPTLAGCADQEALARIARQAGGVGQTGAWRMGAADPDGMDLVAGDAVVRVPFDRPVANAAELRSALMRLIERVGDEQ